MTTRSETARGSAGFASRPAGDPRRHSGHGWLVFAGTIFLVGGALNVIYGVAASLKATLSAIATDLFGTKATTKHKVTLKPAP